MEGYVCVSHPDTKNLILTGIIAKLVDVMAPKPKYDFDAGLRQIEESHKALRTLVKDACTAILVDSNEALKNQSQMIDYIADHSEYLAAHITTLNHAVEALQENQSSKFLLHVRSVWLI